MCALPIFDEAGLCLQPAADGSSVATLGSLCLAAFALAHLFAGILVLAAWRTKIAGAFLVLAGVLFGLGVLFRADCHHGEAGCGPGPRRGFDRKGGGGGKGGTDRGE